jgi:hypothetical protein
LVIMCHCATAIRPSISPPLIGKTGRSYLNDLLFNSFLSYCL